MKHQWAIITVGKVPRKIAREVIGFTTIKNEMVRPTKLIIDK